MKACMTEIFTEWFLLLEKKTQTLKKNSKDFKVLNIPAWRLLSLLLKIYLWFDRNDCQKRKQRSIFSVMKQCQKPGFLCGLMHEIQLTLV